MYGHNVARTPCCKYGVGYCTFVLSCSRLFTGNLIDLILTQSDCSAPDLGERVLVSRIAPYYLNDCYLQDAMGISHHQISVADD